VIGDVTRNIENEQNIIERLVKTTKAFIGFMTRENINKNIVSGERC